MQDFLQWLASWKGITLEEGAELQFEFSSFPTGGLGLLVLLGLVVALLFVVFVYRRDGRNLTTPQRVLLGALRGVAVLAAILLLLEPNLVAVKREVRPGHTILLLDLSQSMNHKDAWRRDRVASMARGWREIGVADPAARPRLELAKALLAHRDGMLVDKLGEKNRVQLYGFSANVEALPTVAQGPPAPLPGDAAGDAAGEGGLDAAETPSLDLPAIEAAGRYTNLGGAVRAALEKSRNSEIAGVVILSDGRRNVGPQGAEVARLLNQRKVPHTLVLGIGDPSETQAVEVSRIEAPEKVFQKDPFEISATVRSQGYGPQSIGVRLLRVDAEGAAAVVRTEQVTVGGNDSEVDLAFAELTSDETGMFTYRVELTPPEGEPPVPERHQKNTQVEVLGEQTRVLFVSSCANHEYRILRNTLIRDKTIEVSCWLQSADPDFPQDGDPDVRIEELPESREDFDPYDVVILLDVDPTQLTTVFCDNLASHVLENGAGLWWIAGEKFTLDAIRPTANTRPVADLLPIHPDVERAERKLIGFGLAYPRSWPYQVTTEGIEGVAGKVTRIEEGKDESEILWGRLPGFHFSFPVLRPKPAATVLVEHTNPDLRRDGRGMPLVVTQFVGAGRVLFNGTDETYRWRSVYEDAYNRFWVKGIRYLFEGRLNAGNSRLRILTSAEKVELGESIKIVAEAKTRTYQPLIAESLELVLLRDDNTEETLVLKPEEGSEALGTYSLQYRPTETGFYRLQPVQRTERDVEVGFQVVPAAIEKEGPMDRAELSSVASGNGGELFDSPAALLGALDRIPSKTATDTFRTPHAVWDSWATVVFIIVVLGVEWLLRKRFNLL